MLNYYLKTSMYTDLGPYKFFAQSLPDDIELLGAMQRMQTIHPLNVSKTVAKEIKNHKLTQEEDVMPTAIAMLNELLRRNPNYTTTRKEEDKLHISCRGQAILMTSILKAKAIPARVRSGFAKYFDKNGPYLDHWICEYYNNQSKRWTLVDADSFGTNDELEFEMSDVPYNQFLFGAEAWLAIRNKKISGNQIYNIGGLEGYYAALISLMDDFNALMGNEKIYLHTPSYLFADGATMAKHHLRKLTDKELRELDKLALIMLDVDNNHDKLVAIFNKQLKFRKFNGVLNWDNGKPYN